LDKLELLKFRFQTLPALVLIASCATTAMGSLDAVPAPDTLRRGGAEVAVGGLATVGLGRKRSKYPKISFSPF
jgi:hypothetical protein